MGGVLLGGPFWVQTKSVRMMLVEVAVIRSQRHPILAPRLTDGISRGCQLYDRDRTGGALLPRGGTSDGRARKQ